MIRPVRICQQPQLQGHAYPGDHHRLHGVAARAAIQRAAEGATHDDVPDPPRVLHGNGDIETEPLFRGSNVDRAAAFVAHPSDHHLDDAAGNEAHRQKHQDGDDEDGGDDQQHPPDQIRTHVSSPPHSAAQEKGVAGRPRHPAFVGPCAGRGQYPISRFRSWSSQIRDRTRCSSAPCSCVSPLNPLTQGWASWNAGALWP